MDKIKVIFVSHCILNRAAKVSYRGNKNTLGEEAIRRKLIDAALDNSVCIVQLPCPEFNIYGANRWGNTKEQFDNPFFKENCKRMLETYILQMEEYINKKDKFEILGIVGIDGSPSCGINFTCSGDWGGEISSRCDLDDAIRSMHKINEKGIFMEMVEKMLLDRGVEIPMYTMGKAIKFLNKMKEENTDNYSVYNLQCIN